MKSGFRPRTLPSPRLRSLCVRQTKPARGSGPIVPSLVSASSPRHAGLSNSLTSVKVYGSPWIAGCQRDRRFRAPQGEDIELSFTSSASPTSKTWLIMMLAGFPETFEKRNSGLRQGPGSLTVDRGQNDQPRVQLHLSDQPPKVSRILGDDDAVFLDAPCKHTAVRRAASPDVQWVHGVVSPRVVQPNR